jgi:lysozyme family protein
MSDSVPFATAFEVVIGHEGGYVNNPYDPGGETKYGVSKRAYPSYDIRNLTEAQARGIYYKDYWVPTRCEVMPLSLAIVVFDAAVNNGVGRAIKWLQEAVGVEADGIIGEQTLAALGKAEVEPTIQLFHGSRIHYMASLQSWGTFGVGWSRRLALLPYQAATAAASVGAA